MKFIASIFVVFILFLNSENLKGQSIFTLNSTILTTKDSTPVGFVHIINTFTNYGVVSEYDGTFSFIVAENDTLKISAIGYNTIKVPVNKGLTEIYLTPKNYDLEEFTVIPYKDFNEFRYAFSELELYDSTLQISPLIFLNGHLYNYVDNGGRLGVTISGGISMLYEALSKQGKSKRRYEQLIIRDRYKAFLAKKFNTKIIKQATYVEDEIILEDFKLYCDFSDDFIEKSNGYEIIKQIQDCYREYLVYK
ncbi:MAG: hypothetical protein H6587_02475 [Flavobacteriales bacterium]|nr:hypothetical protein [Flavobacteriales bacterium]